MSYFGIVVTDGYDWNQCYSWAWECRMYWDTHSKTGQRRTVHDAFPDAEWDEYDHETKVETKNNTRGVMEQVMAINNGFAERPEKVFFEKVVIVKR